MNIFDRTSFRCMISGHVFDAHSPGCYECGDTDDSYPAMKRCTRCKYVMVMSKSGTWHGKDSTAGRMVLRAHMEHQSVKLESRLDASRARLRAVTDELSRAAPA